MTTVTSARVLADSINMYDVRLTTLEVVMWRSMLAELNTHRDFSRNSASSRAIPTAKIIQRVREDPFIPDRFSIKGPGMSAAGYTYPGEERYELAKQEWLNAANQAIDHATRLDAIGIHKQEVNRILEPWMWHTVILSSTRWDNFFAQRLHQAAAPQMYDVAKEIMKARHVSVPIRRLEYNHDQAINWHLPLIQPDEFDLPLKILVKVSIARSARVSYLTHDGNRSIEEDLRMYHDRLQGQKPPHHSPFEHVAHPAVGNHGSGNFDGWKQMRYYNEHPYSQKYRELLK